MKDLRFTVKQQKREIYWLAASFLSAFLLNLFSIIFFDTKWIELITQIGWVIVLGCSIYLFMILCRLLFFGVKQLIRKIFSA